jgi:hypothetical protein
VIFKNQASSQKDGSGGIVNELLQTEFDRKLKAEFVKVCTCLHGPFACTDAGIVAHISSCTVIACITTITHHLSLSRCSSPPYSRISASAGTSVHGPTLMIICVFTLAAMYLLSHDCGMREVL